MENCRFEDVQQLFSLVFDNAGNQISLKILVRQCAQLVNYATAQLN
jgi:hypothetical protein